MCNIFVHAKMQIIADAPKKRGRALFELCDIAPGFVRIVVGLSAN
jgi:hypothetical protein